MKIYGHRGYSALYPENTLLAFQKAVEYHADGIETDVHKTKDGILVLCHDESIDRTSNGTGEIKDMTYNELLQYDFKYNKEVDSFIPIPKLEELLQLAKQSGILLNLEIKTDHYQYELIEQMTYDLVKQYGLLEQTMFSSFNFDSIVELRRIDPTVKVGYLFERDENEEIEVTFKSKLQKALDQNIRQIHPEFIFLNQENMKSLQEEGIEVNAWTINQAKDITFFMNHQLDGCITNEVELGMEIINSETR